MCFEEVTRLPQLQQVPLHFLELGNFPVVLHPFHFCNKIQEIERAFLNSNGNDSIKVEAFKQKGVKEQFVMMSFLINANACGQACGICKIYTTYRC